MITVVAKCTLIDGKKDEYKQIVKELIEETRKEYGCISYDLYEEVNDDNIVTFIEEWESKEILDKHIASEHFKRIVPNLRKLQIKDNTVNIYNKM